MHDLRNAGMPVNDKRKALTDSAQTRVQTAGLNSLSFRTLASDVGIKSSSVHYHFPEKADLAQALIDQYAESFKQQLDAISAHDEWNLKQKLSAFYDIIDAVGKSGRVCLCGMLAAELESLSPSNRQALLGFFEHMEQWLTDVLTAHKAELTTTMSVDAIANAMVSGMEGALLVDRVSGNHNSLAAQRAWALHGIA